MASKQPDWCYCSKCSGLIFFGTAVCAAGGVHDHSQSGDYTLPFSGQGQNQWKWCKKCQELSFTGNSEIGPCPAGSTHDTSASGDYTMTLNDSSAPGQGDWKFCDK